MNPNKFVEARGPITQAELARRIAAQTGRNVTSQTISNWERGYSRPSPKLFDALCEVTGRSPGFFYEKSECA